MKTKLFFSSNISEESPLSLYCKEIGWELTAQSLLQFNTLPFTLEKSFDVVFFSSPRSVNYFISQIDSLPETVEMACVGSGTARELKKHGLNPNFIGEKSGQPKKIAVEFVEWLRNRTVLFPLSVQSNETIASTVPDDQKIIVRCYETQLIDTFLPEHDWYVFTSPSNVEAFLLSNKIPDHSKVVAWGETTNNKLVEKGLIAEAVLEESSEEALIIFFHHNLS